MIKTKFINMDQFKTTWEIQDFLRNQLLLMRITKPNSILEYKIKPYNDNITINTDYTLEDIFISTFYCTVRFEIESNGESLYDEIQANEIENILIGVNDKQQPFCLDIELEDKKIEIRTKFINYKEYIKSEEWKNKRKEVLKRDKFKCRLCSAKGSEYNLHVHHNSYNNLGNEPLEDLITLCKSCHEKHHRE